MEQVQRLIDAADAVIEAWNEGNVPDRERAMQAMADQLAFTRAAIREAERKEASNKRHADMIARIAHRAKNDPDPAVRAFWVDELLGSIQ